MRKLSFTLVGIIVVLFLSSTLFASGVALTGIGARATVMGGNYRAVSDDWSAMYWNPAGITQIEGMHFGVSFELIKPVANYLFNQNATMPFSVYRTSEMENESRTFPVPAGGFVYGTGKMAFGISVFAPFGLGAKWDVMNTAGYHSAYPEIEYEDDLQIIDIHPSFALKLNDKLSVGLGASIVYSDIIIRKPNITPNPVIFDPNYAELKGALSLFNLGALAGETYNHVLTETELTGDGLGFGFNFGLKYDLTEGLSVGLSGFYYNDIPLDGKISAVTYGAEANPALYAGLEGLTDYLISNKKLDEAGKQQLLALYDGEKHVRYLQKEGDADLPLPMTLGLGLAYKGIEKLLVTADVSWTQWSSWDVIKIEMTDGTSELVENWEDAIRFGLGLEYKLTELLALRAGYYTEPSAIPDETLSITIPDPNRRHAISLGLGYSLGKFQLGASYERILIGDREVSSWNYNAPAQGFDNMAGTYKMSVDNVMFGLGYNF